MANIGERHNTGKPKWSLIPQSALLPMVQVGEFGASKYSATNWMNGLKVSELCESLKRHLDKFMEGNDFDDESKLHEIGHIQWNAMALGWMLANRPDLDDRFRLPKKEDRYVAKANIPSYKSLGTDPTLL